MLDRITYKSAFGDYGSNKSYETIMAEVYALRNALGRYEDLEMSPDEIRLALDGNMVKKEAEE